jgi:hypothetical protein
LFQGAAFDGEVTEVAHLLFLKFKTKTAQTFPLKIEDDGCWSRLKVGQNGIYGEGSRCRG